MNRGFMVGMAAAAMMALTAEAKVGCSVGLDRPVLPTGQRERVVVKVALTVPKSTVEMRRRPPVNLCVVLDRSGSMGGDKIVKAREAAVTALRRLGSEDLFSLVAYDHEVETVVSPTPASQAEWIEGRIRSLEPRGNTALFGGVSQGAAEIRRHIENKSYVHRILLLSDGQANVGPSSPIDLERLGAALFKEGISVSTMGVGLDYNEALMTGIATKSDGNTYFVQDASDLPRFFDSELGDVLSIVAKQVVVEITVPEGVRIIRTVGREARIEGRNATFSLNQLYGGQEKYLLLEVEVDPQQPESRHEVASARVVYEDAATLRQDEAVGKADVAFTDSREESERNVNSDVQAVYARILSSEAREQAIGYNAKGDYSQAAATLSAANVALEAMPAAAGNKEVVSQIRMNEAVGGEVGRGRVSDSRAKLIWTKSKQDTAQQSDSLPDSSLVAP